MQKDGKMEMQKNTILENTKDINNTMNVLKAFKFMLSKIPLVFSIVTKIFVDFLLLMFLNM